MNKKLRFYFTVFVVLCVSATLCSCVVSVSQDPLKANASKIQDTEYPQDHIVGLWAQMGEAECLGMTFKTKIYYDIKQGGKGSVLQTEIFTDTDGAPIKSISLQADFRWRYSGLNHWEILLPPSSEYKVLEAKNRVMGQCGALSFVVRSYDGCLYSIVAPSPNKPGGSMIFVRSTRQSIEEAASRARRNATVVIKP